MKASIEKLFTTLVILAIALLSGSTSVQAGLQLEIVDTSTGQVLFTQSNSANGGKISANITGTDSHGVDYSITVAGTSNSPGGLNSFGKLTNYFAQVALSSLSVQTDGAINLAFEVTDNNFTTPAPSPGSYLQSVIRTATPAPSGVSFSTQSFADSNNGSTFITPIAAGTIAPSSTIGETTTGLQGPYTAPVDNTASTPFIHSGPFSLLNVVSLSFAGGPNADNNTVNLTTTASVFAPEPATLTMVLAGLPVAGLFWVRRKTAASNLA